MRFLLSSIVLLAMSCTALGQFQGFRSGDFELTLSGSGSSTKEFDDGSGSGEIGVGYFFTNNIELGLRQAVAYADDSFAGRTAAALDLNIPLGKFQPFVGLAGGVSYGEDVEHDFFIAPEGGVRYFFGEDAFIFARIAYEAPFEDFEDGGFVYGVGIGLRR